jgi:NADH-quinone oxidoreductase subunit J
MIVFFLLAVLVLITAVMAVRAQKLTYAALWLAGTLVTVAALFLSLGAEFLAAMQVLIYAGAVITLILFAIMFAQEESPSS